MPCWVDLITTDLDAARDFYTRLFGWTAEVMPDPEAQGYVTFSKDGKPTAGAGQRMSPDQPVAWTTAIATADAATTAHAVENAGGKVLVPPMALKDLGSMAVFTDHTGAVFSVWQAGRMAGGEEFGKPGFFGWAELLTRDPAGAKDFYHAVFDWTATDARHPGPQGEVTYTTYRVGGKPAAGMMEIAPDWPGDMPSHWTDYFLVDNCDETVALAGALGGTIDMAPADIPAGRFAVLSDPQGASFCVITMNPDFQP